MTHNTTTPHTSTTNDSDANERTPLRSLDEHPNWPFPRVIGGVVALPLFRGWTVDERLREFRRFDRYRGLSRVPFASERGQRLYRELLMTRLLVRHPPSGAVFVADGPRGGAR